MQNGHSVFLGSLSSLALCFSLFPDLFFDYSRVLEYAKIRTVLQSIRKNENRINWYGWPNKITAGLNLFRSLIFDCTNFLQREPKRQLYFVITSLTKSCFVWGFSIFSFCTPAGDIYGRPLLISMEEHTFSLGYNNGWRHGLDPYAYQWFTYTYTYTYTPTRLNFQHIILLKSNQGPKVALKRRNVLRQWSMVPYKDKKTNTW